MERIKSLEEICQLLDVPLYLATTTWEGRDNAWIVGYVTRSSLDLREPYMIVCVSQVNLSHEMVAESGIIVLHLLRKDQWPIIWDFGRRSGRTVNKLEGLDFERRETGAPILTDTVGYLETRVVETLNPDGPGDHTCYMVEVVGHEVFDLTRGEVLMMSDAYARGYEHPAPGQNR